MNGAESMLQVARRAGVDVCFANPGTTEMQLVAALDAVPGMRAVLGLFEGVCTGAADGYARMRGVPALTLLHLGPGFANGLANLHNARRAHSPIVNLIGDHASWHLAADAPLTSDIASLARPMSGWVRTVRTAAQAARDMADALGAALSPPGQVASLIVPQECAWDSAGPDVPAVKPAPPAAVPEPRLQEAAAILRRGAATVLFLGGRALQGRGLRAAARIAAATGCRVMHETFFSRLERGGDLPVFDRLPYFPEQATGAIGDATDMVLAGTRAPVAFFGYRGGTSRVVPETCRVSEIARPEEAVEESLEALADHLAAPARRPASRLERPVAPRGTLTPESLCQALAAVQPPDAIVVDEAATSGLPFTFFGGDPHTILGLTGGSIGQGLPCAVGAAVACPDRRVIAFEADGSGMYTVQALWTMAREGLNVTTLVCANRKYRILQFELMRAGVPEPGRQAARLTELAPPPLDWVSLARGLGVPGVRVDSADALVAELQRALAEPGPSLIEALL
jgi:acetolactate synthase-1/2/3 large subunit